MQIVSNKGLLGSLISLLSSGAFAQGVPTELLLRCEVKQTIFFDLGSPKANFDERTFTKDFRLKDSTFTWAGNPIPIGHNCKLIDGDISCGWTGNIPLNDSSLGPSVEKRKSSVRLSRATGEIRLTLETSNYSGKEAKGKPTNTMQLTQAGVCRAIGKPLF
jgi:hypothetical protein